MSRLESLRESRQSYVVKYREFLRIATKRPDAYVVFFEGQDSKYYAHRLELLRPDLAWDGIDSGGKDNVLKLYALITQLEQHREAKTLYFLDRDFDDVGEVPLDKRVYVTPGYSIENLYATESTFRRVLKHEFGLNEYAEGDDTFQKCVTAFAQSFAAFISCVAELNGWVLVLRHREKLAPGTNKANLNSIPLARIVQVDLDNCVGTYTLEQLETFAAIRVSVTREEAIRAVNAIPENERHQRFRGKFQAYFFRVYLSRLLQDANSNSPRLFSGRRHISFNVSDANFLSELCQYADTPSCLREFLAAV